MSEYLDRLRERRQQEKTLKSIRREAIRPLRAMLADTSFGLRLPDVSTGVALITLLDCWSRRIAWEDCGDRRLVATLQRELLDDVERWLTDARDGVVTP